MIILLFCIATAQELILYPGGQNMTVNIADFGYVPYGDSIQGQLYLVNNSCTEQFTLNQTNRLKRIVISPMLPDCLFISQAMNSQTAGASMLILIDADNKTFSKLFISDHSKQVKIPTVVIPNDQGQIILDLMQKGDVTVNVTFSLVQSTRPKLHYYMSSLDRGSYMFLEQFHPFSQVMPLDFIPVYGEYTCQACEEANFTVSNDLCLSGGRYCAYDPDDTGPLIGRDVIYEDLRQICITTEYGQSIWWQYVLKFDEVCLQHINTVFNLTECSFTIMEAYQVKRSKIDKCIQDSFLGKDQFMDDNTLLAKQRKELSKHDINYWPTLLINGMLFKGDLYFDKPYGINMTTENYAVFEAVCDSYLSPPDVCTTNVLTVTDTGPQVGINFVKLVQKKSKAWIYVLSVAFILITFFIGFFLWRRHQKKLVHRDLSEQVKVQVEQYYRMAEQQS